MTGREKIDAAVDYLDDRGVSFSYVAPPHYRLAWLLGLYLPPPHFQSALGLFAFNALFFGVTFCGMAYLFERHHSPWGVMLVVGLPLGIGSGLIMVAIYRLQAWRLGLPRWSDFPPEQAEPDSTEDEGW